MRAGDESRCAVVLSATTVTKAIALRAIVVGVCLAAAIAAAAGAARRASAAAAVTIASGSTASRTTIPVSIDGQRASCVLDTGTSAILVSPWLAQTARLAPHSGTFEVAPDGRTYVDRQTEIPRFAVAGYALHDVPALISSNLTGYSALCGYDFFARFPTLIDRDRHVVTLFPAPSRLGRLHCVAVDLSPRVPLATVEINDTWVSHVVLDSGMAGGGALWDGVRQQLRRPLIANAEYETMPAAVRDGFACGAIASVRYAPQAPQSSMPLCTEPQRPDGYNGIIETNLPTVHAMAVDYPHRRICFDVSGYADVASPAYPAETPRDAWARFNSLRPPTRE
jgi:predicted aspartyl protease